jgi:hypothetical protein
VSKLETPMIRWYWQQFGGTLVEEFCAVRRGEGCSNRLIDAVLRSIFEKYDGMRVVVCPPEIAALARHAQISSSVSNHPIQRSRLLPQRLAPSPSAVRAEHDASECGTFAFGNQVFALLLDLAEQVTLNNLRVDQGGLSKR